MTSPRRFPALPASWAARGGALRAGTAEDAPFLQRLFISVRITELEPTGWPEEMKHAFLASQFALQTRHYTGVYTDSETLIVTWNGEPVGRLHLSHTDTDLRIVDVSLLPDHRGGGLGSALLQAVQAAADGRTVSLNVDLTNPAQALYRRMGFVEAGTDGLSLRMVWHPA